VLVLRHFPYCQQQSEITEFLRIGPVESQDHTEFLGNQTDFLYSEYIQETFVVFSLPLNVTRDGRHSVDKLCPKEHVRIVEHSVLE